MSNILKTNVENREEIIENLRKEIIGPDIDLKYTQIIEENTTAANVINNHLSYRYGSIIEEIYNQGLPSKKYAAGLLYPTKHTLNTVEEDDNDENEKELQVDLNNKQVNNDKNEEETNEVSISGSEMYKQSTMGITFAIPEDVNTLKVKFECGHYKLKTNYNTNLQSINGYNKNWWMRRGLESEIDITTNQNKNIENYELNLKDKCNLDVEELDVILYSNIRKIKNNSKIVTLTIENRTNNNSDNTDEQILFQSDLEVTIKDKGYFLPYPKPSELDINIGKEEKKFEFLYLDEKNYSFGHDCATLWEKDESNEVYKIKSSFLPEYEVKTMTPDIIIDNQKLSIYHSELAAVESLEDLNNILAPLIEGYEKWYQIQEQKDINTYYNDIKKENLFAMRQSLNRIKNGLKILESPKAFYTFKLVNLAMLMQMNNGKTLREIKYNKQISFSKEMDTNGFEDLNFESISKLNNSIKKKIENNEVAFTDKKWRGFQIAFLLQSIDSIVNKESLDRDIVDLIWFPTGGGKTEAYLAVSAFSMIYRRMLNRDDVGVDTIMRYTLRLLTTDQFQRASRLLVSVDYIRRKFKGLLGEKEFSIGLWVGSSNTPNKLEGAKKILKDSRDGKNDGFVVSQCPWCGAEMKPIKNHIYAGYKYTDTLEIYCPDKYCEFHNHLPIYFIDEVLYKNPPTFLIGTIDKFVQLTWQPKARRLFGLDNRGERVFSPPNLIVQDELHLISGPLGSLTGMYETLIEELTTDKTTKVKPKIICATATIKAYEPQIKALYGREKSCLFPPSGFSINDNFYSKVKTDEFDKPVPGRKYLGVYTTTQGKLQTQVQTFSRLLISANKLSNEFKNPFWTILSFYNTINDIGKANTLADLDIPHEMENYYDKRGIKDRRILDNEKVKELTSRMKNSEVAKSLSDLKINYSLMNNQAIDLVLASNIIEVGVDIDRLALMTIIGQPKTTAQYIQVSGRVGRKPDESPGLVVTIYNRGDSNDKSHYEHFNEFHQKLYANVEETSVTPFSHFSIERGFPAVLIGYLRQCFDEKTLGYEPDIEIIKRNFDKIKDFVYDNILKKMKMVDNAEEEKVRYLFEKIIKELYTFEYDVWENTSNKNGYINRLNAQDIGDEQRSVIFSMRNVDAVSKFRVQTVSDFENNFQF
ncbi:helicase [Staphylococcus xylosus]|uniref:helicase-related protein n=1 Tax=Staphylococcus xylosus TaxID=1288 RepID=UPI000C32380C|nr:helicase-related protein [Staphylococcus xylosus]PKI04771.1 helicase [Staphylococcus xylosus]